MNMKISFYKSALIVAIFLSVTSTAGEVLAANTYHITSGERVQINAVGFNATDCQINNNYHTAWFGEAAPNWRPITLTYAYTVLPAGVVTRPGSYLFGISCQDDDSSTRYSDYSTLIVHPQLPTVQNPTCSAGTVSMNWNVVNDATTYVVRVTKPAVETCPTDWSSLNSTTCQATVPTNSASFKTSGTTSHSWSVASRAGVLVSAVTVGGVHTADAFTSGANFSCAPVSVNVNFQTDTRQ